MQGKRIGHEITFFSIWCELPWGLVTCFIAATMVITILLCFHPSATAVASCFRTVTILPGAGRHVAEIHVENELAVKAGDPLFRLDESSQKAAVETARRRRVALALPMPIPAAMIG